MEIYDFSTESSDIPLVNPLLPQPPFSMAVIGPSRSGKSNFIKNLLLRRDMLGGVFKKERIFIFCQSITLNDDFDLVRTPYKFENFDESKVHDIFEEQKFIIKNYGKKRLPHILLIFDDCADDPRFNRSKMLSSLMMRGRHLRISVVVSGQKFSAIPRGARINLTHLIMFRPYSQNELDFIVNEISARHKRKSTFDKLTSIFETPYAFMMFDFLNRDKTMRVRIGFDQPTEI